MDFSLPTQPTETTSNLSTWAGRPVQNVDAPEEANRIGEHRTKPDYHDISKRLFFYPFSGVNADQSLQIGLGQLQCFSVITILIQNSALKSLCGLYESFAYDYIHLTCSLSAPKGVCGSLYVGSYPFSPWFQTNSLNIEAQRHAVNTTSKTRLLLSPECHLMSISDSQDVKFSIPWSFATSMLKMGDIPDSGNIGVYGTPIVYTYCDTLAYLSSIVLPPLFKMVIQFENLRFYAPSISDAFGVELQSGLEVALPAVAAGVAESVIAATVGRTFDSIGEYDDFDPMLDEGYSKPMPVQQAFAGDTTSVGPPTETAIFAPRPFSKPSRHKIIDYLKRPQFVKSGYITSVPSTFTVSANPADPLMASFPNGTNTPSTYFRWFAQGAQYWRGTINFHLVIFGHPMVEVQHNLVLDYPGESIDLSLVDPGVYVTKRGVSSGTHCIKMPMPYLNYCDMLPIIDSLVTTTTGTAVLWGVPATLGINLRVISTMLDVSPQIPYTVFMSAEEDFCFFQPYAPGLNNVVQSTELTRTTPPSNVTARGDVVAEEKVELQVGIPVPSDVFDTRALPCAPLPYMLPFVHVEDYMEIWSRCLPFVSYDSNDEPVPDASYMAWPVFWPTTGGSAAWTNDVNNSWYITNDYISLFASQYMYYTGSIGIKVVCSTAFGNLPKYKYISLLPNLLVARQPANNPFSFQATDLPFTSNFGNGTTLTPVAMQPVLECVLPYRSTIAWNPVTPANIQANSGYGGELTTNSVANRVSTSVILQDPDSGDLQDSLYRKKGKDFYACVEGLLPPGPLWIAKGYDWVA